MVQTQVSRWIASWCDSIRRSEHQVDWYNQSACLSYAATRMTLNTKLHVGSYLLQCVRQLTSQVQAAPGFCFCECSCSFHHLLLHSTLTLLARKRSCACQLA
jgi:hypothetical protein